MVRASSIESSTMTAPSARNSSSTCSRSAATAESISPPSVESSSAPRTARKRWIGTETSTMISPRSLTRTELDFRPLSACTTSG